MATLVRAWFLHLKLLSYINFVGNINIFLFLSKIKEA